jgi:hypothetical protein
MQAFNPSVVSYATNSRDGSIRNTIIKNHELSRENCGGLGNFLIKILSNIFSFGAVARIRERIAHHEFGTYKENIGNIREALMADPHIDHTVELNNGETIVLTYGNDYRDGIDQPYVAIHNPDSGDATIIPISKEQFLEKIDSDILANHEDYPPNLVASVREHSAARVCMERIVSEFTEINSLNNFKNYQRFMFATTSSDGPAGEQRKNDITDAAPVTDEPEKLFDVALD